MDINNKIQENNEKIDSNKGKLIWAQKVDNRVALTYSLLFFLLIISFFAIFYMLLDEGNSFLQLIICLFYFLIFYYVIIEARKGPISVFEKGLDLPHCPRLLYKSIPWFKPKDFFRKNSFIAWDDAESVNKYPKFISDYGEVMVNPYSLRTRTNEEFSFTITDKEESSFLRGLYQVKGYAFNSSFIKGGGQRFVVKKR